MKLILEKAYLSALEEALKQQPHLANEFIIFGPNLEHQVHPLHYVCDCVFEGKISEAEALAVAKCLVQYGAEVNGTLVEGKDSPLIAASSLYCDDIALYYIALGADVFHRGTHIGTCLHWACWTGASKVVMELLKKDFDLEDAQNDFQASPLHWAIHGLTDGPEKNHRNQVQVIQRLLEAGASSSFLSLEEVTDLEKYASIKDVLLPYLSDKD